VTDEGRETVRGVQTTHHSTTIDLHQSEFAVDVWIDDHERIRRFEWAQGGDAARMTTRSSTRPT
jgi:hypothetical protein